jgi:hypothetical protein
MPPRLTFLCCLALLGACQEAPEVTPAPDRAPRAAAVPGVVARAGEEPILLTDIEQPVAMQLHDLELRDH